MATNPATRPSSHNKLMVRHLAASLICLSVFFALPSTHVVGWLGVAVVVAAAAAVVVGRTNLGAEASTP